MSNWFKRKSQEEILMEKYQKLLAEAYRLSTINRMASDQKQAEAQAVMDQIEAARKNKRQ
ncbi:MAG: Lacal_2735 family protein [Cyclobacteriaceae bacterium]